MNVKEEKPGFISDVIQSAAYGLPQEKWVDYFGRLMKIFGIRQARPALEAVSSKK